MKLFQTALLTACFALSLFLTACGGGQSNTKQDQTPTETPDQSGPEYTSAYICPMHCTGSGSDQAGTCPVCGMDYVVNEDQKDQGEDHEDHEGHDHEH